MSCTGCTEEVTLLPPESTAPWRGRPRSPARRQCRCTFQPGKACTCHSPRRIQRRTAPVHKGHTNNAAQSAKDQAPTCARRETRRMHLGLTVRVACMAQRASPLQLTHSRQAGGTVLRDQGSVPSSSQRCAVTHSAKKIRTKQANRSLMGNKSAMRRRRQAFHLQE